MSAFGLPPSPPPCADVLYVWPLRVLPRFRKSKTSVMMMLLIKKKIRIVSMSKIMMLLILMVVISMNLKLRTLKRK